MKATEALKQGKALVIEIDQYNRRVIADLFQIDGHWVFVDIGWTDPLNTGHPYHMVDGELTGEGPWQLGRYKIEEIGPDDPSWTESQQWAIKAVETNATTERAIKSAKSSFGMA